MPKMIPKEIRIDEKKLMNIRELMVEYEETNESAFIRDLIDIGYAVKKAQLNASDDEEMENWQAVYQDAAKKMIECHHLIRQAFAFTYNAKLSRHEGYGVELKENKRESDEYIANLLSGNVDSEKLKGSKGK
ncbi:hypothetical protein GCM10010995_28950 [Cysteiniphilum litorale]|uniref:Uncharacterized protein n=4 Tax=Cysteiniphilum TaxID=2056696 RepID=A0A8J2Z775_9GAMM|nr:hypothetical protein GCM10010995_28950 [Cysteiniphilum litorale]